MIKKISNVFKVLLIILVITTFNIKADTDDGNWTKMGGNNTNSKVLTNPNIIKSNDDIGEKITVSGYFKDAIIIENLIYVVNGKPIDVSNPDGTGTAKASLEVYNLDGVNIEKIPLAGEVRFFSRLAYDGKDTVFVSLSNCIQAIDITSKESLWISENTISKQMLSQIIYHDGYLYGGVVTKASFTDTPSDGFYFAIDTSKEPNNETKTINYSWTWPNEDDKKDDKGFYWDGAAIIEINGKEAIVFAGDSGEVVLHDLKTSKIYDNYNLSTPINGKSISGSHKVRSLVYYNDENDELLIGTQNSKKIFKIPLKIDEVKFNKDKIQVVNANYEISGGINLSSKGSGNLYVSSGGMSAKASAFSIYSYDSKSYSDTLQFKYSTSQYGTQSFPLINIVTDIKTNTNTEYTYFIDYNSGDLIISKLEVGGEKPTFNRVVLPKSGSSPKNNSASVIAAKDGTLVTTKNDGGPLFIINFIKDGSQSDVDKLNLKMQSLLDTKITTSNFSKFQQIKNDYIKLEENEKKLVHKSDYEKIIKKINSLNNTTKKVKKGKTTYYYKFKSIQGKWFNYKTIKKTSTKITTSLYNYSSSRMKGSPTKRIPLSGALKKKITAITIKSGRVTGKKFNYYNSKGKLTKLLNYKANKKYKFVLVNKQTKSYYKNGKIKRHFSYNKSLKTKKYTSKTQIYYNSKGKKTKRIKYTYKSGKVVKKTVKKY